MKRRRLAEDLFEITFQKEDTFGTVDSGPHSLCSRSTMAFPYLDHPSLDKRESGAVTMRRVLPELPAENETKSS